MPNGKQQTAVTLSFSRKNLDIFNLLVEKRENGPFNQNEYICNAIRFYEENKGKNGRFMEIDAINKLIEDKLIEFKNNYLSEVSADRENNNNDNYFLNIKDNLAESDLADD